MSGDNLADNLWAEMAKWQAKSPLLTRKFEWTKTRIFNRDRPETWWMSARTWARTADKARLGQTLAGLHSDYILFILDESGGIPDAVMASAEAALSTCVEGHIVQAGNPTHLEGPLWRACTSERRLWHVTEISADPDDPKRATRVKAEWAKEQIEKYGRDNPWVLVNVFGQFPPASLDTLIGPDECRAATTRAWRPEDIAYSAKVLGVDVARFGDDASGDLPAPGAGGVPAAALPQHRRHAGRGRGGAQVDRLAGRRLLHRRHRRLRRQLDRQPHRLGRTPIGIPFSGRANDPRYDNKRTEMYFEAVDWIRRGGQLPPGQASHELIAALSQTTYSFRGDRLLLEPKEQVKSRLGYSPDDADAFVLTFAQPVAAGTGYGYGGPRGKPGRALVDYDVLKL